MATQVILRMAFYWAIGYWLVAWICFTSNVSKIEFFVFSDNKCKLAVPFNDLGSSKCMRVAQRMISKTDL